MSPRGDGEEGQHFEADNKATQIPVQKGGREQRDKNWPAQCAGNREGEQYTAESDSPLEYPTPSEEKKKSEVSSVVCHLLSDGIDRLNDICVEDMPVSAIRNLVSRQLGMSIQILLQMLLVSNYDSECFNR